MHVSATFQQKWWEMFYHHCNKKFVTCGWLILMIKHPGRKNWQAFLIAGCPYLLVIWKAVAIISQRIQSNQLSQAKIVVIWFECHWINFFPMVQLAICHYLNQWLPTLLTHIYITRTQYFNMLRLRQNGSGFTDDTFKRIFLNENVRISIKISMKFVPTGPISNIPAWVQIMAWRRSGSLNQWWLVYWCIYASLALNEFSSWNMDDFLVWTFLFVNSFEPEWHIYASVNFPSLVQIMVCHLDGTKPLHQAIIWTSAGILSIWPIGTNFSEISIDIDIFSFKKIHLKMSSAKCQSFCLILNVLVSTKHLKQQIMLSSIYLVPVGNVQYIAVEICILYM